MSRYINLIAVLLFLLPTFIYSGSPKEDFNDDVLLAQAVLDIQKMPREELNTFISYLASCEAHKGGQIKEFFCERDRETYLIKYERGRSIDRLISVLAITWMWMDASDKVAKPKSKQRVELGKALMRYGDITQKLREAANRRFRQLSTK